MSGTATRARRRGIREALRRNHRVGKWSPVIPVELVPKQTGGDICAPATQLFGLVE
jgi:hypothetical protein